jgi:hypothetical protein
VVIIPAYPVASVLVQDLIGHVEQCYFRSDPTILLHAQLFQRPCSEEDGDVSATTAAAAAPATGTAAGPEVGKGGQRTPVVVHSRDVQRAWQDIRRVITNHGNLHTPKV